ncbi:hypothetical protein FisN_6Lh055 [Fistulifera solaris]|uniref:Spore protein YkvP/CgeB glycosyl transferase-like domain-containing protein n=1 Tax=Fistulifera solaris TaxID=1519565 RepID=A0A1Z5KQA9_FISSO|nr:hypothetical protein FisN_6Lh055 [Fistulifera solaris]|eukprot:GAX28128.1 hypothetical protein FisN_6Lh055 [Fistulifera solaris]
MKKILQSKLSLSSSPRSNNDHSFARILWQALQLQRIQKIALFAGIFLATFHILFQWHDPWYNTIPLPVSSSDRSYQPSPTLPQPVYVWPLDLETNSYNTEILQIAYNGIQESRYLSYTTNRNDPNAVWIGDAGAGYWLIWYLGAHHEIGQFLLRHGLLGRHQWGYDRTPWCHRFLQQIQSSQQERRKLSLPLLWPIYILDLTDFSTVLRCPEIEKVMGSERVFYGKRSIVHGRLFSQRQQWTQFGQKAELPSSFLHTPLIVRTDTVQGLHDVLLEKYNQTLASPIEELPRTIDVAHFWAAVPKYKSFLKGSRSHLKDLVSDTISDLGEQYPNMNVFVGFAGSHGSQGRLDVASAYIEALLDAKIVVVTQTDRWEDHYRLYEALVTGSMVITDRMLSLPRGLINGTSVIECTSRDDLRSKSLYYLSHPEERIAIARHVAMSQHRSWHRMEELIFGEIKSQCSLDNNTDCPFVVHAS